MKLENRTAIVTGGAQGIGYAIAQRFLDEGARVMIADNDDDAGEEAVETLSGRGEIRFVDCDVSQRLDVHNLLAATLDVFGTVDILVSNAALTAAADFLDIDEETFDRVLAVNLKGALLTGQAVAKQMVKQIEEGEAPGSIITMSSINAQVAIPNQVPYTVSKGGIEQLTKVMALSLAPYGIRVNAIGPGSIMTRMLEAVNKDEKARRTLLSRTPLRRVGEPKEIAAVAAFLASDDASYITGETIFVDGGRLALNYVVPVE